MLERRFALQACETTRRSIKQIGCVSGHLCLDLQQQRTGPVAAKKGLATLATVSASPYDRAEISARCSKTSTVAA
jgi:hypothetical protein